MRRDIHKETHTNKHGEDLREGEREREKGTTRK